MRLQLEEVIRRLKQQLANITSNPLLDFFDQQELAEIDANAEVDPFLLVKKNMILKLVTGLGIDFNEKLKTAFDEYNEAVHYRWLKTKFPQTVRIKEEKGVKTPDFYVPFESRCFGESKGYEVYIELKTLSFADGNNNYKSVMDQALLAQIDIESQLREGSRIAFGEFEVSPLQKANVHKKMTTRDEIATVIDKIDQNIKSDQFGRGDTILFVDMKQIGVQSGVLDMAAPVFLDSQYKSNVSGLLWNAAFGRNTDRIFKPIDFEGRENIDLDLGKDGILHKYSFIRAICFRVYPLSDTPSLVGMVRHNEGSEAVCAFLNEACDYHNDDMNTNDWKRSSTISLSTG